MACFYLLLSYLNLINSLIFNLLIGFCIYNVNFNFLSAFFLLAILLFDMASNGNMWDDKRRFIRGN